MLPEPEDPPSGILEPPGGIKIPRHVPSELFGPIVGVRPRNGPVIGAGVPIAAVDEDRDVLPGKHDVRCATERWLWAMCDAVSKSCCVQESAHCQLRRGIAGFVGLHYLPCGGTACPGLIRRHLHIIDEVVQGCRPCVRVAP